jgi:hypothetical protein
MTTLTATRANTFTNSLGVNTHIDFNAYGYQNLATVESALKYLGVRNVRDSAESSTDLTSWQQVAQATGVKFDDYIPEGSPADMQGALNLVTQLANEGVLNFVEGGNEEDDDYAAAQGNTLAITAQFQQQVFALGQKLGLPVINMSFGSGWTAVNNWQGDYDKVGDLSAYANYGSAHTYPNPGQTPDDAIQMINGLSKLAAVSRPVITTEIGWDNATFTQGQTARYVVDAALDGIKDVDVKLYYYSLFDDGSGQFGLMNQNGTPKPAGTALHDLTTLLADTGANAATFTPGSLTFTLTGNQSTDNTLLFQKSNGTDWLALWNETAAAHTVTLTLGSTASQILMFDPVKGTTSIATASNTNTISISLGGDPLLIEVIPSAGGSGTGGSGGSTGSSSGSDATSSPNPVVTVPTKATVAANGTVAVSGVSVTDAWASHTPGALALNVTSAAGTVTMLDASGNKLSGSGTTGIHVSGTLSQINAELKTLTYAAGASAGGGTVTVDIWDQAGVEATKTVGVTISSVAAPPVVTVPVSETVATSATVAITGASVTDPWAAQQPGFLALNVSATNGTVSMLNASGAKLAGSGTTAIHVSGTLSQIDAELKTLTYTAGSTAGIGSVTVDVRDQAGVDATKSVAVTISTPNPPIAIAATDANPVVIASKTVITASAGDHMIFIGGTGDKLTATGGTETVQAYLGHNTITTGAGNDAVHFAGSGNVINAGAGNNMLFDSGSNNTVVLPATGYDDLYGYMLTNGAKFDLRSLLAHTSWQGDLASIGNFIKVATSGNCGMVSVDPSGTSGGASHLVATFESSGQMNLSTLLAHAIT